jgi:hypothetical protein
MTAGRRRWLVIACLATGFAYFGGQVVSAGEALKTLVIGKRGWVLAPVLESPVGNATLKEYLRAQTDDGSAILAVNGQYLGMVLDRTVVGLPMAAYSKTVWDEKAVFLLVKEHEVSHIFLSKDLELSASVNENNTFITQLVGGSLPEWLSLQLDADVYQVYRVEQP